MAKIAVLDDSTKTAHIIGHAASPAEAAKVFRRYMRPRMDPEDFATLQSPQFVRRATTSVASPAFEPLWAVVS